MLCKEKEERFKIKPAHYEPPEVWEEKKRRRELGVLRPHVSDTENKFLEHGISQKLRMLFPFADR